MREGVQKSAVGVAARVRPGRCALGRLACALALLTPVAASAATVTWNGYASFATDYMYRGVSLLESGVALQGGLEARADDTFVAGAWAANIDRQWGYEGRPRDRVLMNLYTGADVGCGSQCRMRFLVTGYVYTGADAHDWQEASASIAWRERVGASVAWSPHGLGTPSATRTLELWYLQPLTRSTSIEFDAGSLRVGSFDYWFARAGVAQRIDRWLLAANYYASDPSYARYGLDSRSKRLVFSVSTAF